MALTQTGLGCGGAAASYQSCRAAQLQSVVLFHTLFAQMAERGIEWLKLSRREHPLPSSLYLTRGGLIYEHVHKGAPLGGGNYKKVCRLASLIPGVKEMVQAPYDATALARLGPRYLTEFIQILQRFKTCASRRGGGCAPFGAIDHGLFFSKIVGDEGVSVYATDGRRSF